MTRQGAIEVATAAFMLSRAMRDVTETGCDGIEVGRALEQGGETALSAADIPRLQRLPGGLVLVRDVGAEREPAAVGNTKSAYLGAPGAGGADGLRRARRGRQCHQHGGQDDSHGRHARSAVMPRPP